MYCRNCLSEHKKLANLYAEVYFDGDKLCEANFLICFDCAKKIGTEIDEFRAIVKLSNGGTF